MKRLLTTLLFMMFLKLCISQSISGTYKTEWGDMTLQQTGSRITGTYTHGSGTIEGTLNGTVLTGTWKQTGNKNGKFRFEFNDDFSAFKGKWNYGDAEPTRDGWTGKRATSNNPILSGTFSTEWGDMVLQQNGSRVTGTYTHGSGTIEGTLNGKVLTGTWKQTGNKNGKFRFEFNDDFSAFKGKWNYGDAEPTRDGWTGKKK
jgi:hypothetical protein